MGSVAIAHDQFRIYGGAERVAVAIARAFDAPIYAMRVDEGVVPDDVDVHELAGPVGQRAMASHYMVQDAYQMLAWQHQDRLYQYDTIIETKMNPGWFVPKSDRQTVIRYVNSTPRSMYDMFEEHGGDAIGDIIKTGIRTLYAQTTTYPDRWLCNSETVERRLHRYLGPSAPSETVYPPVNTQSFSPDAAETGEYLFHIGRLASNKRIGLLADVARAVDREVVVAGDGPERETLLENAPENLTYLGYIDETEKRKRLAGAAATLFLAEHEDFGIVPIESFATGTPVIGVAEGFTKYQIFDGENGFVCLPTVRDVGNAIKRLDEGVSWSPLEISAFAEQFSERRFRVQLRRAVDDAREDATVEPDLAIPEREARQ